MGTSSSRGPFMLAALIFFVVSNVTTESEGEKSAQLLSNKKPNTQLALIAPEKSTTISSATLNK